jgi:O-antigen/teichoic acid export membrane protein
MPSFSRKRLAALSWGSSLLNTLGVTVIGFVATPLLVRWLGPERLGATRTTEQVLGYLSIFYVGLAPAFAVQILRRLSESGRASAEALIAASRRALFRHSLLLLPFGLVLAFLALPLIIRSDAIPHTELVTSAAVAVTFSILLVPLSVYRDLLECEQRSYWVQFSLLGQALVVGVAGVLFARAHLRLPGQFAAIVLGSIVYYGALRLAAGGLRPLGARKVDHSDGRPGVTWRERWPLAITAVGNRVNLMSDAITVSILFGPLVVTDFTITQRLVLTGMGLIAGVSSVSWAPLGDLLLRGELVTVRQRMNDLLGVIAGAGVLVATVLAAYNRRFVTLWVGANHYAGDALSVATALQGVVFGFFLLFAWTLDTQGHSRSRVAVSSIGSVLNLGLSFFLGVRFGPLGVCLATSFAYLLTDAWFCPLLFIRHFALRPADVLRPLLRSTLIGIPWIFVVWFVAHRPRSEPDTWLLLSAELLAVGGSTACYFLLVVATKRFRREVLVTLRSHLSPTSI